MSDLDAIRAQRLAQLQAQQAGGGGPSSSMMGGPGGRVGGNQAGDDEESRAAEESRRQQEDEMRRGMMSQVLESEARERLSRISLTRPGLAKQIEDLLIRMARSGQIREKVSDDELKRLLTQVSNQSAPGSGSGNATSTTTTAGGRTKVLGAGITSLNYLHLWAAGVGADTQETADIGGKTEGIEPNMSHFPLNPSKTNSGIILDPKTLERVVPTTKRKDGTQRKELKIRPGFTPEEDVQKYQSAGRRETEKLKGFVPGAQSMSAATYVSDFPALGAAPAAAMTKAQKKNAARKKKRAEAANTAEGEKDWDEEESEEGAEDVKDGSTPSVAGSKSLKEGQSTETWDDVLEQRMDKLSVNDKVTPANSKGSIAPGNESTSTASATSSAKTRPPRPGGGLFRDLPIKSKSEREQQNGSQDSTRAPIPPQMPSTTSPNNATASTASLNRARSPRGPKPNANPLAQLRNLVGSQQEANAAMRPSGRR